MDASNDIKLSGGGWTAGGVANPLPPTVEVEVRDDGIVPSFLLKLLLLLLLLVLLLLVFEEGIVEFPMQQQTHNRLGEWFGQKFCTSTVVLYYDASGNIFGVFPIGGWLLVCLRLGTSTSRGHKMLRVIFWVCWCESTLINVILYSTVLVDCTVTVDPLKQRPNGVCNPIIEDREANASHPPSCNSRQSK